MRRVPEVIAPDDSTVPAGHNQAERAVAVEYHQDTPIVSVKAEGRLAAEMVEVAEAHHVPVHHDEALLNCLYTFEKGQLLSEDAAEIVAEVLSFLYRLDREASSRA